MSRDQLWQKAHLHFLVEKKCSFSDAMFFLVLYLWYEIKKVLCCSKLSVGYFLKLFIIFRKWYLKVKMK